MKSYTDIEQSKKLAEILPSESADMFYCYGMDIDTKVWSFDSIPTIIDADNQIDIGDIPCWSLASLLNFLPMWTLDSSEGPDKQFRLHCKGHFSEWRDNPVDVCYETIIRLHKNNLL